MTEQRVLNLHDLRNLPRETTTAWVTPSVRSRVEAGLGFTLRPPLQPLPSGVQTLVVIAGGTLIDEAKVWRLENAPLVKLIAVPSIWGSGAEASPIAVRNRNGKKDIRIDPKLLPDARGVWPELAASVPTPRARMACGDCWAHALEGFLSPLAGDPLRLEISKLIRQMLRLPLAGDPAWFELSARACAGQAQASVGVVHGIAHVLEGALQAQQPAGDWNHAKLCSIFLFPVMRFNQQASGKWQNLLQQYELPADTILKVLRELFDCHAFDLAIPALSVHWMDILRDPCTRTNSTTVRPSSLDYFVGKVFL